jgi:hypothetical protein
MPNFIMHTFLVLHILLRLLLLLLLLLSTSTEVWWSEFLATAPEVRIRLLALPDFMKSSGSRTGSIQPLAVASPISAR